MGMHPHILRRPNIWGCIPIYQGSPTYVYNLPDVDAKDASLLGCPRIWECIHLEVHASTYTGVFQYMGMHPHVLGHPTPSYVYNLPKTIVRIPLRFLYMGMHSHILRYPRMCGCIPIYWGIPANGEAC
jgi:hypothetical protein